MPNDYSSSGLHMLDQTHVQEALKFKSFQEGTIPHATTNKVLTKDVTYVFDPIKHILIITSTINPVSDYPATLKFISKKLKDFDQYHLIIPLVGEGITERHIVTAYKAPGQDPILFDPKGSDPEHFLTPLPLTWKKSKKLLNIIRSFFSNDSQNTTIPKAPKGLQHIRYEGLGTQSFFDGVTCGLHAITICRSIVNLVTTGTNVSRESLLKELSRKNVIQEARSKGRDTPLFETSYESFFNDAVEETFSPDKTPLRGFWSYVAFIIKLPLKIIAEFPLKLLSKTCNYVSNQLQQLAPTTGLGQFLRSAALVFFRSFQGLFNIAHFIVRSISDPITNYQQAKYPALKYLSAALSVVGYSAITLFALPALLPGLGVAGTIAVVAKGVSWLLGTVGLNLAVSNTVLALAPISMGVGIVTAVVKKVPDIIEQYRERAEVRKEFAKVKNEGRAIDFLDDDEEEEFTDVSKNSRSGSYSGSLSVVLHSKAEVDKPETEVQEELSSDPRGFTSPLGAPRVDDPELEENENTGTPVPLI